MQAAYTSVCAGWPALIPPSRIRVSEGARSLIVRRPGGSGGPWDPTETPYMVEPVDMLASLMHSAVCFVGPAQTGKALDLNTPIPTPSGWTTMGALQVGDRVFDDHGQPTRVVFATEVQHGRECFEVVFADDSRLIADADHQWAVERWKGWDGPWQTRVVTTRDMLADLAYGARGERRRYRVRNAKPLQMAEAALPLDPYLLGVWLGDGASSGAAISAHVDDAEHYVEAFQRAGHVVRVENDKGDVRRIQVDPRERLTTHCQRGHELSQVGRSSAGYCRRCEQNKYWRKTHGVGKDGEDLSRPPSMFAGTFASRLREAGVLANKHIPRAYLRASEAQRWALLQGLMDTDGTCSKRAATAEFTAANPNLAVGLLELAASLGLKPRLRFKATTWVYQGERKHGTAFRVTFPVPAGTPLFRLPRKAAALPEAQRDTSYRQVVSITPVSTRPVRCIQVDAPSHVYLAGVNMVPTHNTIGLGEGWMTHAVTNDPGDMLIVQMTQEKAREYSRQRIDRAIRNSPRLREMKSVSSRDDNMHDKWFRNGMQVKIAWPTATNLSSTSYRYVFGTDYDRWDDNIDGEGDGFTLMGKRITTFLSRGMVAVESSPGRPITDPFWTPATPHEAPPVSGILGIYNRGDRRRWMWPCPHCDEWFEAKPGLGLFGLPDDDELLEGIRELDIEATAKQYARVICPHCGSYITPEFKEPMNRAGRWLREGMTIDRDGQEHGTPRESSIASYWLGGVAATYIPWVALIRKHLQALLEFALTGTEETLQTTANTDQCLPYLSRALAAARKGEGDGKRIDADLERYIVPDRARFLLASVDVQGGRTGRFEVQVHAVGEYGEEWLVDRFPIKWSKRPGVGDEFAPIDPARYPEDWGVLVDSVLRATYRTTVEGRELKVRATAIDTGGEDGVTANAYTFWKALPFSLRRRAYMVKGDKLRSDWIHKDVWIDGVQLHRLNVNKIKDAVDLAIRRTTPGPNYYHWPAWLPRAFFDELKAEIRGDDGQWSQVRDRNEAFDLCVYIRFLRMVLGCEDRNFWKATPAWALPLDQGNSEIIDAEERRQEKQEPVPLKLPAARKPIERRSRPSAYMRG